MSFLRAGSACFPIPSEQVLEFRGGRSYPSLRIPAITIKSRQISRWHGASVRAQVVVGDQDKCRMLPNFHGEVDLGAAPVRTETDGVSRVLVDPERRRSNGIPASKQKARVIVIAGPTAVGKTRLSLALAKSLGGEIINADSVQVIVGLDVGAAKITMIEREGIPHHLLDMVPPTLEYTYPQYFRDARAATEHILAKGCVPIVVGGTGTYIRWYMNGHAGTFPTSGQVSQATNNMLGTDIAVSDDLSPERDYDFQCYFLYQHRAELYQKVDFRCEQMVSDLLRETAWLLEMGIQPDSNSASRAIGYEEAMAFLLECRAAGGITTEERFLEFLRDFQHSSKYLVRKQIKWFRSNDESEVRLFHWMDASQPLDDMVETVEREYRRPPGSVSELKGDEAFKNSSFMEQNALKKNYTPTNKIFSDPEACARIIEWIKRTQGGMKTLAPATHIHQPGPPLLQGVLAKL